MIPQRDLSRIANGLLKPRGRRVPETVIERDYCLAWFLTGLAQHPLREFLAFKGGTALRRCWFDNYRFSEDLDFSLIKPIELDVILSGLNEIFAMVEAASGINMAYDRPDRHGHQNTHTFYLSYKGPLPARSDVKVDITINEVFCFPLTERPILRTFEEFSDLPEGPPILAYSLAEIFIEKLAALPSVLNSSLRSRAASQIRLLQKCVVGRRRVSEKFSHERFHVLVSHARHESTDRQLHDVGCVDWDCRKAVGNERGMGNWIPVAKVAARLAMVVIMLVTDLRRFESESDEGLLAADLRPLADEKSKFKRIRGEIPLKP